MEAETSLRSMEGGHSKFSDMRVKGKEAGRVVNTWSTREMLARSVKQLLVPVNCHAVRLCSGGKDHLGDGEMHLVQRQLFLSGVRFLKHVDPEKLKENARNRGIALDVDKMVSNGEGLLVVLFKACAALRYECIKNIARSLRRLYHTERGGMNSLEQLLRLR